jgi:dienelactone hydrolase
MESLTLRHTDAELAAEIFRPERPGRRPAVVVAPGGLACGDLGAYRWAGEGLAAAGYVALVTPFWFLRRGPSGNLGAAAVA